MSSYPPPDPSWVPEHGDHDDFGGDVSPEDRNWAMAAHLGSILTAWFALGLMAPLLVLVLKGGSSHYVRRHAVESLNFQINAFVYSIVFTLLLFVLIGLVLLPAYLFFYLVCVVLGTMRASAGEEFHYPLTLRLVS
jgi:Uncharacterized protein conserved in bacteria